MISTQRRRTIAGAGRSVRARRLAGWLGAACAAGLVSAPVHGQEFGRNKVLWEDFDFEVLETEHFEIHYYPKGNPSAGYVARVAERWYARLSGFFDYELSEKKPLVIYKDHADFQQTMTTPGLIGEATGGFTEGIQNRVVLPLTGINGDNDHVIGHELVHAFQYDMAQNRKPPEQRGQAQQQQSLRQLPLWMVEGLAEYLSQGRNDPLTAMYMRDAVLHETLPEPGKLIQRQPSPYQYGQAIWAYVGGRWGDDTVRDLFKRAMRAGPEKAIMDVLDLEQDELFEQFHSALRSAYDPILAGRRAPEATAEPLLTSATTGASVNVAPSLSPDGSRIAFISTREFAMDLYLADTGTGEIERKLITADADPHFDNLSFLDSSVAWSPDGKRLAFGVFAKGERRLAIYDVEKNRIERRLDLPGIHGMRHPAWSPDGRWLVFSAVTGAASDLYRIDLGTGDLERLTNDGYTAIQPAVSPGGDEIAFVTDRGSGTDLDRLAFSDLRIATLDLETREVDVLPIFGHGKQVDPHYSPDGRSLYFVGDPEGAADLYRYDLETGRTSRLAAPKTGVSGLTGTSPAISVASATGTLAMTVLEDGGWNIYRVAPSQGTPVERAPTATAAGRLPPEPGENALRVVDSYLSRPELGLLPESRVFASHDYESDIHLANIGPATIGIGRSDFGAFGGGSFSAYFSDTLSRHQIQTTLQGGSSNGVLGFADTLGGSVTYLNLANRFQWGAGASRIPYLASGIAVTRGTVDIDGTPVPADIVDRIFQVVTEQRLAMLGRYPLSVNNRFEVSTGLSRIDFDSKLERTVYPASAAPFRREIDLPAPEALNLRNASVAFVRDTSRFGFVSPLRGARFRVENEWTTGDLEYRTSFVDIRKYWLARRVTFALRAMEIGRRGPDADDVRLAPLDIARGSLVRGYAFEDFDTSECTRTAGSLGCPELERLIGTRIAALNFEVRLPLLGNEDYGFFNVPAAPTELFFFVDAGAAWTGDEHVEWKYDTDTTARVPVVSTGIGVRTLLLGSLPIELYYADPLHRPQAGNEFGFRIRAGW